MRTILWVLYGVSFLYILYSFAIGIKRSSAAKKLEKRSNEIMNDLTRRNRYIQDEKYVLDTEEIMAEADEFDQLAAVHRSVLDQWEAELNNSPFIKSEGKLWFATVVMILSGIGAAFV